MKRQLFVFLLLLTEFVLQANRSGAMAQFSPADITEVVTEADQVTPGQQGIAVLMQVRNPNLFSVSIVSAKLTFSLDDSTNINNEYQQSRTDTVAQIPGDGEATLEFTVAVNQEATRGRVTIDGEVSIRRLLGIGTPARTAGAEKTDSWTVLPILISGVSIEEIIAPDEYVSQGQQSIPVRMQVSNINPVDILISSADLVLRFSDNTDVSQEYLRNRIDQVTQIRADGIATLEFGVNVSPAATLGEITIDGKLTGITPDSVARVNIENADQADIWTVLTPPALRVDFTHVDRFRFPLTASVFDVEATVTNEGESEVASGGELTLAVPQEGGYQLITPESRSFNIDEPVIWQVLSPDTATSAPGHLFIVTITKAPAAVIQDSDSLFVRTLPDSSENGSGFIAIDSVRVVLPDGAKDGVLSTDQNFAVAAFLHRENASQVSAQIFMPSSFDLVGEDFTIDIADGAGDFVTAEWQIQAPRTPVANEMIYVVADGVDSEVPQRLGPVADTLRSGIDQAILPIDVVEKARLRLSAMITAPPSALDSILIVNQNFTVTSLLEDIGSAGIDGETAVEIVLPVGFVTDEPLVQTVSSDLPRSIDWHVRAPSTPASLAFIGVRITKLPNDINTGEGAVFEQAPVSLPVSVQAQTCLAVSILDDKRPTTVVRNGKNMSLLGLWLENTSDLPVTVESILLQTVDGDGKRLAPNSLFDAMRVVDAEDEEVTYTRLASMPAENPIEIRFAPGLTIAAAQTLSLDFQADINPQTPHMRQELIIENPATDILAIDGDGQPALIGDAQCRALSTLTLGPVMVSDSDLQATFFNYPNPFGNSDDPARQITKFNYYLETPSEVVLRIHTLLGRLVITKKYAPDSAQGRAGLHDGRQQPTIIWDGKNGQNLTVLNGVYIAILHANGKKAMTKVAVMK